MPESEVHNPSPKLVHALQTGTKLAEAIERQQKRLKGSIGAQRRFIDREIEGMEKRLRKTASLIGSLLDTEGFSPDYKLPEDDNDEISLVPA